MNTTATLDGIRDELEAILKTTDRRAWSVRETLRYEELGTLELSLLGTRHATRPPS